MIKEVKLDGQKYRISTIGRDFFAENIVKQANLEIALGIMNNCLDVVFDLTKPSFPKVFRPPLYVTDKKEWNAMAVNGAYIIVCAELLFQAAQLISQRYTQELLEKYGILDEYTTEEVQSNIRVYIWRYIVLHELYHIWNGHSAWKSKYKVNKHGEIVEKATEPEETDSVPYESECVVEYAKKRISQEELTQHQITEQSFEIDADSSAVCMLINLLMYDCVSKKVIDKQKYVKDQMACIMAALATVFCLFDNNAGADFSKLNHLDKATHPLPSIRMAYAEEIADVCLQKYFGNENELREVESEWLRMVCDIEPDQKGIVDLGQVFYFTAYTEKAQRHLCKLKHRITDIHDSLEQYQLANSADKLEDADMEYMPEFVWFSDDGKSLRGWTNPATGKNTAQKAKPKPIVKAEKIGPNDPCPCGSGTKYKKCDCGRYRSERNK